MGAKLLPYLDEVSSACLTAHDPSGLGAMIAQITSVSRAPSLLTTAGEGELRALFANDSFLNLSGCSRTSITSTTVGVLLSSIMDSAAYTNVTAALSNGNASEWRLPFRASDGSQFWAAVFVSPVFDGSATPVLNVLSIIKTGEDGDRLIERQDELNALYENAPGFIATSSGREHLITFANASYKRFVGNNDLVGHTVKEAMPSLAEQGILDLLDNVFDTGVPFVGSDVAMRFDTGATAEPTIRYCDFIYQPVRAADGSVTGLFCEGYDVTDKHLAAEVLSQMQSEMVHLTRVNSMGTMAATLAHELNQPLTAIGNYAEAAAMFLERDGASAVKQGSEALAAISELTQRMGGIIRNLRDLAAHRQGQANNFSLNDAAMECARLIAASTERVIIIEDVSTQVETVFGDRIQVQQVLMNLFTNSIEATPGNDVAVVKFWVRRDGDYARVCISDAGCGLDGPRKKNIFQFQQSSKAHGMGIGLSVCRTIIEGQGGQIWLESTSPEGTQFCFTLPIAGAN